MSDAPPASRFLSAAGWIGLVIFLGWHEFYVEIGWSKPPTPWWFRVPMTLMIGLAVFVFALECLMQEMTVRRWATSALVFGVFGILFLLVGVIDPEVLQATRWVLIPLGLFYLGAAGAAGLGAKDSL